MSEVRFWICVGVHNSIYDIVVGTIWMVISVGFEDLC